MQHVITISDLVWWGGGAIAVLTIVGIVIYLLAAIGQGMSR